MLHQQPGAPAVSRMLASDIAPYRQLYPTVTPGHILLRSPIALSAYEPSADHGPIRSENLQEDWVQTHAVSVTSSDCYTNHVNRSTFFVQRFRTVWVLNELVKLDEYS